MKEEDKKLLLKDLSSRLTYDVKAYVKHWAKLDRKYYEGVYTVESIHPSLNNILVYSERFAVEVLVGYDDYEIKPYLFPLSSMTKEQEDEWYESFIDPLSKRIDRHTRQEDLQLQADAQVFGIEYLLKNHFDIHGLIPMGLALDATGLNIY